MLYCGRNVGQGGYYRPCGTCDGRCGPNNGCQCYDCHEMSSRGFSSSATAEDVCGCCFDGDGVGDGSASTANVVKVTQDLRWNKKTLKVGFFPPKTGTLPTENKNQIMTLAREWTWYANIDFQEAPVAQADIRIAFSEGSDGIKGGYWSHLGKWCANQPTSSPTMNLQNHHLKVIPRKVRHEFGHALGFYHEHQLYDANSGVSAVDYNEAKVLAWYKKHSSWGSQMVKSNVLTPIKKSGLYAKKCDGAGIDQFSVMLYPLKDGSLLTDPSLSKHYPCEESAELSVEDILHVMRMYPGRKPPGFSYTSASFRCPRCCQTKASRDKPLLEGNPRFDFSKDGYCMGCALSGTHEYKCRVCGKHQRMGYQLPSACTWHCHNCDEQRFWRPVFK